MSFDVNFCQICSWVEDCNYRDNQTKNEIFRDKIILTIKDPSLRTEMLKKDNLTLLDTVCRAAETTETQMKSFAGVSTLEIKQIDSKKSYKNNGKKKCSYMN